MWEENSMKDNVYCFECDYAITKLAFKKYAGSYITTTCPRCGINPLWRFYSYGSVYHQQRRESWEKGIIVGNPPPLPRKKECA